MRLEAPGAQRLEAFSDGVIAIIVTITVFGLPRARGFALSASSGWAQAA